MSRKPDYVVKALNKHTDEKNKVGAAWLNKDGSVSVVLDPFITLTASKSLVITIFPIESEGVDNHPPVGGLDGAESLVLE